MCPQLIGKMNKLLIPVISKRQFQNVTSSILNEIVSCKTYDNDKNTEIAHDSRLVLVAERVYLHSTDGKPIW